MAKLEPYKTHLAYVKERRTEEEAATLLDEALDQLRARRGQPDRAVASRRRTVPPGATRRQPSSLAMSSCGTSTAAS